MIEIIVVGVGGGVFGVCSRTIDARLGAASQPASQFNVLNWPALADMILVVVIAQCIYTTHKFN